MKLSVSLPTDDVAFLDQLAAEQGMRSRSALVQDAIRLLRAAQLTSDYAAAASEWEDGDGQLWSVTDADGLGS
jgi:Arc/MetJ-type ribon-helix-helix transcriptional regulator